MTFLPIVARELRVASRRRVTYWARAGAACSLIIVGTWVYFATRGAPRTIGLALFGNLTGAAILYCLFSGIRFTADCLSEEKREGTLGLLFLTDLKGYDVVLGKLAGTSLNAFYSLVAVIPLLAVPLLLGGVTVGEFGRMAVVALNTLFFSLSIGLGVSAMSRSARKAVVITFLLLFLFAALLPAIGALLAHFLKKGRLLLPFLLASPGFSFYAGFSSAYKVEARAFWWSAGVIHGLSWFFLVMSVLVVPRSWQDKPPGAQRLLWRERWRFWTYGSSAERLAFRTRLLEANPFYWLAARARPKPALVWATLGLLACVWIWGWLKFRKDWLVTECYFMTALILNMVMKTWITSETGRQLAEDRKNGALELLLSTPLTVREILRGQRLNLQRQFLRPLLLVILIFIVFMITSVRDMVATGENTFWIMMWSGGIVMLIADISALYWVGMWQAIASKHPNRAASATAARILVLPWIAFLLISSVVVFSTRWSGHTPDNFFLGLWLALGFAMDIGFGGWARHKLLSEFRLVAVQRSSSRPTLLKRLFAGTPKAPEIRNPRSNSPRSEVERESF